MTELTLAADSLADAELPAAAAARPPPPPLLFPAGRVGFLKMKGSRPKTTSRASSMSTTLLLFDHSCKYGR